VRGAGLAPGGCAAPAPLRTVARRRQALVSIGNATGAYKVLIKYIGGVPQVLLDFIKTINDDHGPLEEIRATYGPTQYKLTEFVNRIHGLLALLDKNQDADADRSGCAPAEPAG
jgi:hypothetical protein